MMGSAGVDMGEGDRERRRWSERQEGGRKGRNRSEGRVLLGLVTLLVAGPLAALGLG